MSFYYITVFSIFFLIKDFIIFDQYNLAHKITDWP